MGVHAFVVDLNIKFSSKAGEMEMQSNSKIGFLNEFRHTRIAWRLNFGSPASYHNIYLSLTPVLIYKYINI